MRGNRAAAASGAGHRSDRPQPGPPANRPLGAVTGLHPNLSGRCPNGLRSTPSTHANFALLFFFVSFVEQHNAHSGIIVKVDQSIAYEFVINKHHPVA